MENKEKSVFFMDDIVNCSKKRNKFTAIYFVLTDENDYRRFERYEHVSRCKIGLHAFDKRNITSMYDEIDKRASDCAKGVPSYRLIGYLLLPYSGTKKVDDIIREKFHERLVRVMEPFYDGPYTIKQEGKSGRSSSATELAYHFGLLEMMVMFRLVYKKVFGHSFDDNDRFRNTVTLCSGESSIMEVLDELDALCRNDVELLDVSRTSLNDEVNPHKTNVDRDIYFHSKEAYMKYLYMDADASDRICVISSLYKDAMNIRKCYPDAFSVDIATTCYFRQCDEVTPGFVESHRNVYDAVIMHIPSQSANKYRLLTECCLVLLKKNGRMCFVCDSKVISTMVFNVHGFDECALPYIEEYVYGNSSVLFNRDELVRSIEGHVVSVDMENLNFEYGCNSMTPFVSVKVDFSRRVDRIDSCVYGWKRMEKHFLDCTLFGSSVMTRMIVEKMFCAFPDAVSEHMSEFDALRKLGKDCYVLWYPSIKASPLKNNRTVLCRTYVNGIKSYIMQCFYKSDEGIVRLSRACVTDELKEGSLLIYSDSRKDLENYVKNTGLKLMKFLALMMADSCRNKNDMGIVPFISGKSYSDEELFEEVGLTRMEREFVSKTVDIFSGDCAVLNRMETGSKLIRPNKDNPKKDDNENALF